MAARDTAGALAAPLPDPGPLDLDTATQLARRALDRCDALAAHSEHPDHLARRCLTGAMADAHATLRGWMEQAGLTVEVDAIGNLRGVIGSTGPDEPRLVIGSHLDTIRDAGKYDGPLGVVLGLTMVEAIRELGIELPYAVEVVGFSDEEGVRFGRPFLGSLALVGKLKPADLALTDDAGTTVAEAMDTFAPGRELADARLDPETTVGYLELHIEQGPVLESAGHPVGVVEAIAGHRWETVHFTGEAGHAGTTPMDLRRDAMTAAAELVLAVEDLARRADGLVATVGDVTARPGGNNVIAGRAAVEVDARSADAGVLERALLDLRAIAADIARRRGLTVEHEVHFDQAPVKMDAGLRALLREAVADAGQALHELPSGAGHDARILAPTIPSAMLFLRSPGGLSHHPDERVHAPDVAVALRVAVAFLVRLAARFEARPEITGQP